MTIDHNQSTERENMVIQPRPTKLSLWKSSMTSQLIAASSKSDARRVLREEFDTIPRGTVVELATGNVDVCYGDDSVHTVNQETAIDLLARRRGLVGED